MLQRIIYPSLLLLASIVLYKAYVWKCPDVNHNATQSIWENIYTHPHKTLNIRSFNNDFTVNYVEYSSLESVNPYFPAIHITSTAAHDGWIQIVYTDYQDPMWQQFIDAIKADYPGKKNVFPFYNLDQDFYDAPLWNYTLFHKPLTLWQAHAYAISIDPESKNVKCLGGVKWGYKLSYWQLRPVCLTPQPLMQHDWEKDYAFFKKTYDAIAK